MTAPWRCRLSLPAPPRTAWNGERSVAQSRVMVEPPPTLSPDQAATGGDYVRTGHHAEVLPAHSRKQLDWLFTEQGAGQFTGRFPDSRQLASFLPTPGHPMATFKTSFGSRAERWGSSSIASAGHMFEQSEDC
jgi:hypothetical protein